jgi:hypothetical protein
VICPACRRGGEINARANTAEAEGYKAPIHREIAADAHSECAGGTWCCCAHATEGVNWVAIRLSKLQKESSSQDV